MRLARLSLLLLLVACRGRSPTEPDASVPPPWSMVGQWTGRVRDDFCGEGTLLLDVRGELGNELGRFFGGRYERTFPSSRANCSYSEAFSGTYMGGRVMSMVMHDNFPLVGECKWIFDLQFMSATRVIGEHARRDRSCNPPSGGTVTLTRDAAM